MNQQKIEVLINEAGAEDTERGSVVGTSNDAMMSPLIPQYLVWIGSCRNRHQGQKVDESERTILEYFLANSSLLIHIS